MTPEQVHKLLTPLIKAAQSQNDKALKYENTKLKGKLKKALEQRDEWRYQAQKYQAKLLEKIK